MKVTVDKSGRFVIPKEIRELSGFTPGEKFEIDYVHGQIVMEPVSRVKLVRKGSFLVGRVVGRPRPKKLTLEDTNRMIRRLRDGRL